MCVCVLQQMPCHINKNKIFGLHLATLCQLYEITYLREKTNSAANGGNALKQPNITCIWFIRMTHTQYVKEEAPLSGTKGP